MVTSRSALPKPVPMLVGQWYDMALCSSDMYQRMKTKSKERGKRKRKREREGGREGREGWRKGREMLGEGERELCLGH